MGSLVEGKGKLKTLKSFKQTPNIDGVASVVMRDTLSKKRILLIQKNNTLLPHKYKDRIHGEISTNFVFLYSFFTIVELLNVQFLFTLCFNFSS